MVGLKTPQKENIVRILPDRQKLLYTALTRTQTGAYVKN